MSSKLIYTKDLKPGMVFLNSGYTDIILTVIYDGFIRLNFLGSDGIVRNCTYRPHSKVTIHDPS